MDIQGYRATPEDVNTRKCVRACARGIVYTGRKDPRALALHLRISGLRLTPRRASGLGRQGLRQRGRTPARKRPSRPVKSSSTVRESVRLRPSLRVLGSVLRSRKNGPSNKRVTKCTENPVLWGGGSSRCAGRWHACKVGEAVEISGRISPKTTHPNGETTEEKPQIFFDKGRRGRGAQNL